jgi:hypothetical protein
MEYYRGNFNYLKLIIALMGSVVIMGGLFLHNVFYYSLIMGIGWFLICYAMSLHRYSETIVDLDMGRVVKTGIAWVFLIIGTIILKYYKMQNTDLDTIAEFKVLLFFGVIFSVLAKGTFIAVELNLSHYTQYITILSIAMLSIATIMNSMGTGKLIFGLSLIYYLIGLIIFSINLSYNPDAKIGISNLLY